MKKIAGLMAAICFMFCFSLASAKSMGLGSLSKNLSKLAGDSTAVTGTIPEGRELLPAVFAIIDNGNGSDDKTSGYTYLYKADVDGGVYAIKSILFMKILGGLQKQVQDIEISEKDGTYSVNAKSIYSVPVNGSGAETGERTESMVSSRNKLNKMIGEDIEKTLALSDAEYEVFAKKAYTDLSVLQAVAMNSANKLKAKLWFKKHPVEGSDINTKALVVNIDESKVEGYSYKLSCLFSPKDTDLKPVTIVVYTNNDEVIEYKEESMVDITGKISKISFNDSVTGYEISYITVTQ